MLNLVETLNAFVSEARNNKVRLQRRVDELAGLVLDLRQEMKSLKESAIMAVKANTGKKTTKERSRSRVRYSPAAVTPCIDQHSVSTVQEPTPQVNPSAPADAPAARVSELVESRTRKSATTIQNSNLLPSFEDDKTESGLWELVCSKKPTGKRTVLFVGNLPSDTSAEKLSEFVTTCASTVKTEVQIIIHECKIFRKESSSSARLVVNSKTAALVNSKVFRPRPVHSRQWNFEKYSEDSKGGNPDQSSF